MTALFRSKNPEYCSDRWWGWRSWSCADHYHSCNSLCCNGTQTQKRSKLQYRVSSKSAQESNSCLGFYSFRDVVDTRENDVNIYNRKPNIALKPTTTHPAPSQMVSTTEQKLQPPPLPPPKHYTVDSDHYYEPPMIHTNPYDVPRMHSVPRTSAARSQKAKPKTPPKPIKRTSEQECSSAGVYMSLNPASMGQGQDQQYMSLGDATRWGSPQDVEEPQYMNCQGALGDRWTPMETGKL